MLRRSLVYLVVLVACGPAQRQPGPVAKASPVEVAGGPAAPARSPAGDELSRVIAKLDDPREAEGALAELEALGDPRAIPGIGKAWAEQGRPIAMMRAIIGLARPLTPQEATAGGLPAYAKAGRPAHWEEALPFLRRAIAEIDEASPRSVENANRAADALGEARLPAGTPVLGELAQKMPSKKIVAAQIAAIRALGKLANDRGAAAAALLPIAEREPPPHPRRAGEQDRPRSAERFDLALAVTGATINALGELRAEAAIGALVLAMYRLPELNRQSWRALVAIGPPAAAELRRVLRGEHAAVNELFRAGRLDRDCGERDAAPCVPVSAMDSYAASALGWFHDPAAAPELLAALKRPAAPAYFIDGQPGPAQHLAIVDALRRIGAPEAAAPLRELWRDRKADLGTRAAAIAAYPFVAQGGAAGDELGKIAEDNRAEDELRMAAAAAYARLSRDRRGITLLQALAKRYLDASADRRRKADPLEPAADAADQELDRHKQRVDAMKADLLKLAKDPQVSADQLRAATAAVKQADADLKAARLTHRQKVAPFKEIDQLAKGYLGFARMFQIHIARVEVAIRCQEDLACFAATLRLTTEDAARNVLPYAGDVLDWTAEHKAELVAAAMDRALLEIGRRGAKARHLTATLLEHVAAEDRAIRQPVLLALPRIARPPCAACVEQLSLAIQADQGKTTRADLAAETTLVRSYFASTSAK